MQNERNMHAHERKMQENARKSMQNEWNMKRCWHTWNQQNNSSIHFRVFFGMDFGFILDLEYADFQKSLESDRAPKSDDHNDSN